MKFRPISTALVVLALFAAFALFRTTTNGSPASWSRPQSAVQTGAATGVTSSAATLNGTVKTRGTGAMVDFQWGTTTSYGWSTPGKAVNASRYSTSVASTVSGLKAGATFHYRLVAKDKWGTSYGTDRTFTTAATPTPTTTTTPTSTTTTTAPPTSTTTTSAPPTSTTTTTTTAPPTSTTTSPSSTSTTQPAACSSPAWTSSASQGSWNNGGYVVNNNMWSGDAGPQTISACAWNRWSVTSNQSGSGTDDSVKTYPDTQRHVSYPLSSLTSLPSSFDVTTPSAGGVVPAKGKQWNAAYDLWLDNFGTEVMVWNNWTMNWQYWYTQNHGVQVTIDGVAYHAYTNGSGLWFVRDNVTNKGSVDLAHILQWAVSKGWLKSSQTLGEVEYGFEVSYTGEPTTFTLNDYTLSLP